MSPDDDLPSTVAVDGLGEQFTAEEQAQFAAMQTADDGGDLQPDPAPEPSPPPPPPAPAKAGDPPPPPAPEPSDDDDVEVPGPVSGKPQKRVSIHKYQRLEQRAKEAEERAEAVAKERQELLERTTRADERLRILSEAMQTPAPQEEPPAEDPAPDPEKDIFGYAQWQGRQITKLNDRLNGIESGAQAQVNETQIATTYQQDAARFAASEPGFAEAYVYLIRQRDTELQLAGVSDPQARNAQIVREERGLVQGAISQKRSPAEMIFNMAKGRGYQPKAAPPPPAAGDPPPPPTDPKALDAKVPPVAPAAPPAAPPAPAKPSVTEEIEAIKRGQEAAASLSNVGGGAPLRELTSKTLADMPEEEFNRLLEQLPRERQIELMGN